jgi:Arm DNA-binding domain
MTKNRLKRSVFCCLYPACLRAHPLTTVRFVGLGAKPTDARPTDAFDRYRHKKCQTGPNHKKLSDGGGLQLWIMPSGSKLWCLAYRDRSGKQKKLSLDAYPALTLTKAREKRESARALIVNGIDPGQQAKIDKANREANTFGIIAAELLAKKKREGKASNTIGKREWLYGLAGDSFGQRPIVEITASEVLHVLQAVEGKGLLETARRMRSSIGEVFRFAIATGRAESDPTFALRGALAKPQVKHRAAIVEPKALGGLLRAIEAFEGQPTTIAALKLLALLFW